MTKFDDFITLYHQCMGSYLEAEIPGTPFIVNKQSDWTLLLDKKQDDFSKSLKKLCFGTLKKLNISSLWKSFVAYILEQEGIFIDETSMTKNNQDEDISVYKFLKSCIDRSRKQIRENCRDSTRFTLSSVANINGGKGKKRPSQSKEEINEKRRYRNKLIRKVSDHFYFYNHDLSCNNLTFSADLKEIYAQDEGKIIFLIGYNDEEWKNFNDRFGIAFWKQDNLLSKSKYPEVTGKTPSTEAIPGNRFFPIENIECLDNREQFVTNDNLHYLSTSKDRDERAFSFSVCSDNFIDTLAAGKIGDEIEQKDITEEMIVAYADRHPLNELQDNTNIEETVINAEKNDIGNEISETQEEKEREAAKGLMLFEKNKSCVNINSSDVTKSKEKIKTAKVREQYDMIFDCIIRTNEYYRSQKIILNVKLVVRNWKLKQKKIKRTIRGSSKLLCVFDIYNLITKC